MIAVINLLCGALFAAGVCISGMVRPSKILAFLDVGGPAWEPSLLLVMGAGVAVMAIAWQLTRRLRGPAFGARFPDPPSKTIDRKLVGGAALFGIGWGLAGYCPGPAIVSLASGVRGCFVFAAAMIAGMFVYRALTGER
jgi:uncharacterized membrane protein YedE/YeeE